MKPASQQTAFLFPGQGSQKVGMGRDLAAAYPAADEIFQQADVLLGFSISRLMWEGPEDQLNDTLNTQPALLVHSVAALRAFQTLVPGFSPAFVAGHSMGELSALAACGALPFAAALQLVRERGRLMKEAGVVSPGGMAAIMGLDIPTLDRLCQSASLPGEIVQVANDNCPGQVVISGAKTALERVLPMLQAAGARRVIPLAVSIAAHSPLMESAQAGFNQAVQAAPIQDPNPPLLGNVTAQPLHTEAELCDDLCGQLTHRVRWTESIQRMQAEGVNTYFEMGSGSVLCGLIKRIDPAAQCQPLGAPPDFGSLV